MLGLEEGKLGGVKKPLVSARFLAAMPDLRMTLRTMTSHVV